MNILILGSGGREHAMAWKMKQSPLCQNLYIAPGNAGTSLVGENISLQITDFQSIKHFILNNHKNVLNAIICFAYLQHAFVKSRIKGFFYL